MCLINEVNEKTKTIHTDGYPMSIGELSNLYRDGELELHPEFQRLFRWSLFQKTRLIESVLLGIPIPSVFVVQREDGVWDVIDGLQRLSTIFEFMGMLKNGEKELVDPEKLQGTDYLPSLKDCVWNMLPKSLQIDFKRVKIDVKIIKKQSDSESKFEMFQRLNTGGSRLSDQEVRNCLLVMSNLNFYKFILELSEHPSFIETIGLSERLNKEKYNMELVCRYLAFKPDSEEALAGFKDLNDLLNNKMLEFADDEDFDYATEKDNFKKTFDLLSELPIERPFAKYDVNESKFKGQFLISAYEAIAIGIGYNIDDYSDGDYSQLEGKIINLWSNPSFTNNSGSGSNARARLPKLIPLGKEEFARN